MTYLFDNINSKNKEKLLLMLEANTLHFKKDSTILSVIKNDNIVGIITSSYLKLLEQITMEYGQ